jgi:hypothetical protein
LASAAALRRSAKPVFLDLFISILYAHGKAAPGLKGRWFQIDGRHAIFQGNGRRHCAATWGARRAGSLPTRRNVGLVRLIASYLRAARLPLPTMLNGPHNRPDIQKSGECRLSNLHGGAGWRCTLSAISVAAKS